VRIEIKFRQGGENESKSKLRHNRQATRSLNLPFCLTSACIHTDQVQIPILQYCVSHNQSYLDTDSCTFSLEQISCMLYIVWTFLFLLILCNIYSIPGKFYPGRYCGLTPLHAVCSKWQVVLLTKCKKIPRILIIFFTRHQSRELMTPTPAPETVRKVR
jgi:hypothetical protein